MKKVFSKVLTIAFCIALCSMFTACGAHSDAEKESYNVNIEVEYKINLLFSTYGAKVYVDDKELGTIEQGETLKTAVTLTEGRHKLKFRNIYDDGNQTGSYNIKINGNRTVKCKIKAESSRIEVKDVVITSDNA